MYTEKGMDKNSHLVAPLRLFSPAALARVSPLILFSDSQVIG